MSPNAAPVDAAQAPSRERLLIDSAWRESHTLRAEEESPLREDLVPGYRIVRRIGRGGQGAVYEATAIGSDRRVAIKIVQAARSARHRARLLAEIAAQRRLDHPNILPILDAGETDDGAWFATPLVEGGPLDPAHLLSRMSRRDAIAMFVKIARAVQQAHLRGVLHRDLKPSNILIDEDDEPFVVDFGLARLDDISGAAAIPALTMSGEFVGSLAWASPEQLSGEGARVDVRSDVYALGVILHQIVTRGGTPFGPADDVRGLMRRILHEAPISPRRDAPDLPRDLETIIFTCLQRDPDRRYQSAGELARDLERWLAGEPIEARRRSAAYAIGMWVRRHRAIAALAGLLGLTLIGAVVGVSVAMVRATHAEAEATRARIRAEALNTFLLEEILAAPSPERQGRDVRLVDALRQAALRLDSSFPDDPAARADVARTIGVSFMALGLYDESEALLETSRRWAVEAGGARSDGALASMNQTAKLRWLQGRTNDAAALFESALAESMRAFGPSHDRALEAMTGLAVMRRLQGDLEGARELCERALAIRLQRDGPLHKETITLTNNLALIERQAGNVSRAIELLRQAHDRASRSLGAAHPTTILAGVNLASALRTSGNQSEATALLRAALEMQIETLGAAHPETAPTRLALAESLIGAADDEATALLDDAESVLPEGAVMERRRIAELRRLIHRGEASDR